MQSVQLIAYGDAVEGLALREIAEPARPAPGEVLVQVCYAPINFNDLMVAWGVYNWKPPLPETLGNEGAGVVLQVGDGVTGFAPGMPVVLPFMARSWRERLVVRADELTPLPVDADLQQASMATINAVTASMLLSTYVDLRPGDAVAYNAASAGLGHWVAGLAKHRGLRTVGLVRRPEDLERVQRSSGCEIVLMDQDDASTADPRLAHLDIRLALDGVGGPSAGRLAELLGNDGVLVTYGAASRKPMHLSAQHLIFKRLSVHGFFEGHADNREKIPESLADLREFLRPGGIRQPIAGVYPAARIKEAVAHAIRGGKVLLDWERIE